MTAASSCPHALARNIAKSVTASLGFLFRLLRRRPPYHDALAGTVVLRRKFQSSYEGSTPSARRPGLMVGWGIVGILFAFGLFRALFLAAAVSLVFVGYAMAPTYLSGQHVIAMRTSYLFSSPQRGDVIVFHAVSAGKPNIMQIDRVVGIPGDTVAIRNGGVTIDGLRLLTPPGWTQPNYDWGPRRVPAGHYFVLGDNRADSFDSHDWPFSPWVARDDIVGKVH